MITELHKAHHETRLPEQCLRLHGLNRIQVAMDPFTGLGSTAVACARLGVSFIGSDLDETYLDAAVERVLALGKPRMAKATTTSSSRRSAQAAV